jgi:hypothetical protein
MSTATKALLRFARSVVRSIVNQTTQQINLVSEQVQTPLNTMVQSVVGGVWRGRGAEAFIQEINGEILPMLSQIVLAFTGVNSNITYSIDSLDQADEQVRSMSHDLGDLYEGIYKG